MSAWSLALIVLNVVIHVIGLGLINESVVRILSGTMERRGFLARFAVVLGVTALLATVLHGIEAAIWATANRDRSLSTASSSKPGSAVKSAPVTSWR